MPAGPALDVGCGTGTDTVYLARHGCKVTGIDIVPKALTIARRNATAAGVAPRLVEGDVTRLDDLGVGDGFTLPLDFGCFHTLPQDRRGAYVTSFSHAAAPHATLLVSGFSRPPKAAPMHAGMTVDEVKQRVLAVRAGNWSRRDELASHLQLYGALTMFSNSGATDSGASRADLHS